MTSARRVATPALLGGWGALLAWLATGGAAHLGLGPALDRLRPLVALVGADAYAAGWLGGLVGMGQVLAAIRNTPRLRANFRPSRLAWALAAAAVAGLIAWLLERLAAPPWLGWAGIGAAAGAIEGSVGGSRRSTLAGSFGGAAGGAAGGLLVFRASTWVTARGWHPLALEAAGWALAGALIGIGAALARQAVCPAWVRVSSGPRAGLVVPMDRPVLAIGSHPMNDIELPPYHGRASGLHHARIRQRSGVFKVENTCGIPTYVGRDQVNGPRTISHGERISIAGQTLRFRLHPFLRLGPAVDAPITVTFAGPTAVQTRTSAATTGLSRADSPRGVPVVGRRSLLAWVPRPEEPDEPDDAPSSSPRGPDDLPAPTEAEIAQERVTCCPGCDRRYFGRPDYRYCDHCQRWF